MPDVMDLVKKPPTDKEKKFLSEINKPGATIEVLAPTDMDPADWMEDVDIVCRGLARAEMQAGVLLPVLGRLLVIAKDNPEIMAKVKVDGKPVESFEAFLEARVYPYFPAGRSTCYFAMKVAERYPKLDTDTYRAVTRRGFQVLLKAVPAKQVNEPWAKALIKKAAAAATVADFEQHCEEKGYLTKGEVAGFVIRISTTRALARRWEAFVKDPEIQAYCKSDSQDVILKKLMEECGIEWKARVKEAVEEPAEVVEDAA